jgi:hypothetical protein
LNFGLKMPKKPKKPQEVIIKIINYVF